VEGDTGEVRSGDSAVCIVHIYLLVHPESKCDLLVDTESVNKPRRLCLEIETMTYPLLAASADRAHLNTGHCD
jgi:hypothetical protein